MKLRKALENIRFYTGTPDDINNKAVNPLFTNTAIVNQLNIALNEYARYTKAIEDVYSFVFDPNQPFVEPPPLALRSDTYRYCHVIIQARFFPMDFTTPGKAYTNFPYSPIQGITNWLLPWGSGQNDQLYAFPLKGTTSVSTTIAVDATATDTTIEVASTNGFLNNGGRLTIGTEKVHYAYKDATHFYGCRRGIEQTTAQAHATSTAVTENSVWLYYSRLHEEIPVYNDVILDEDLDKQLDIPEEHIETILKYTAYNLLIKLDPNRASPYKLDYATYLDSIKRSIAKGRSQKVHRNIQSPYMWDDGQAYWNSLMF